MNVLFLTVTSFTNINERGIYYDLMRKIISKGHSVFIVSPIERRYKQSTSLTNDGNCHILRVKTLNIQKTNVVEKGIGTVLLEYQFKSAIKKFLKNTKFDLIIYSTPPITITSTIEYIKKRDNARTYLLLKDIFPQNAVDLGMISNNGFLHKFFRRKENQLYMISDRIGCMSPANVYYLRANNPNLDIQRIHVNPNSIEVSSEITNVQDRDEIRKEFNIPANSTVFVYGGNIGKPQCVSFLLDIILNHNILGEAFFVIVGSGTDYNMVESWFNKNQPTNALLIPYLQKSKFDSLLSASDVGLIFLDPRFTIPNFPSRMLSYLEFSIPILAATDLNTDIGSIAQANGFGYYCENGDKDTFIKYVNILISNHLDRINMGIKGRSYLQSNYSVDVSYSLIFENNVC